MGVGDIVAAAGGLSDDTGFRGHWIVPGTPGIVTAIREGGYVEVQFQIYDHGISAPVICDPRQLLSN